MNSVLNLLAKSKPKETIKEHTELLLHDLDKFFEMYGNKFTDTEKELVRLACRYHDYGKAIYPFQQMIGNDDAWKGVSKEEQAKITCFYKIIKEPQRIPHGFISPAFLSIKELKQNYSDEEIKVLINAIFYHHNRNYDFDKEMLKSILDHDLKVRFNNLPIKSGYLNKVENISFPSDQALSDDYWTKYAVILGLLNKFDYHASSHSELPIEISPYQNGSSVGDLVNNKLIKKYNKLRSVQVYMEKHFGDNLVVVASTGIGKTEAALLWAGGSKSFYTLPLKISINAIYERIKNEYDYSKDRMSLLHSDAMAYLLEEDAEDSQNKYKATRFLSYPLTICTIDQLFTFVYKYRGSEQLLATLKYSKVIIDEIQSYSPQLVAKIIYGLKLITKVGGKFAIVTATMPPVFEYFMNECQIEYKKPNKPFLIEQKARHFITSIRGDFDFEFIEKQAKSKKVLIICNTVKKAQNVYDALKLCGNVSLLHSHFIKAHRKILEDKIMRFTLPGNRETGIWISTQIVEASLDIDFDILFTEMCTADSLLQRLGRCFRRREYIECSPNVYIYNTENGYGTVYEYKEIYDRSVLFLQDYNNSVFTEEQKLVYVNKVYSTEDLVFTKFFEDIRTQIRNCENAAPGIYTKEEAMKSLRNISSLSVIPEEIYCKENSNGAIDDLINIINSSNFSPKGRIKAEEKLNSFTISIGKFSKLAKLTDLVSIDCSNKIKIYRINAEYEFSSELKGKGLQDTEYVDLFL